MGEMARARGFGILTAFALAFGCARQPVANLRVGAGDPDLDRYPPRGSIAHLLVQLEARAVLEIAAQPRPDAKA
jgi:hypothetical protein